MLGLYIHIPFCNQICPYCDFYKMVVSNKKKETIINALLEEMKKKKIDKYSFKSLYIGGGSPSCLDINLLEKILFYLNKKIDLENLDEFTIELNPNDITESLVSLLSKYHVSRVSIGIQTFNERLQNIINRPFTKNDLINKLNLLNQYKINNVNLDMIYAIPSQTLSEFEEDLNIAISLNPNHLSIYSLILEEHTIFYHLYNKGKLKLVDEDTEAQMYKLLCDKLKNTNFIHYETSNFAKEGYYSKHNLIYWNCDEYIGIGPAASSYINNYRITNINNLDEYLEYVYNDKEIYLEKTYISKEEAMNEFIMLGLRKIKGISKTEFFKRFNLDIKEKYPSIINLISQKNLIEENDYIFIPEDLFYISNYIITKIIWIWDDYLIKKKLSKTTFSVLLFCLLGFIFGIFSTNTLDKLEIDLLKNDSNIIKTFLNAFTINYWYLFIIWFLGLIPLGFIITYFISFFKSCLIGITFGICLKASAIFGFYQFISFSVLELLIIIPTTVYIASKSININIGGKIELMSKGNEYFNVLIKTTILIIIYAILSCLKMTLLEVK